MLEMIPEFADEWDDGDGFGYNATNFSYHSVFLTFNPISNDVLYTIGYKRLKEFCEFINYLVDQEAVSYTHLTLPTTPYV